MTNDQDDLLPAEAPLDALLRERVGDDAPPDLSSIIAARHARGEGEAIAVRLEQFESPVLRGLQRPLLTAAMALLGIGAVVGTIWNSNATTDNDPNNLDTSVATQRSQDPQATPDVVLPETVAPPRPLDPDNNAPQGKVEFRLRVTDRHGGPVQNFELDVLMVDPRNLTLMPTAALKAVKRQPKDFVDLFTTIQGLPAGATYVVAVSDGMHATSLSEPFTPVAAEMSTVTVTMNFGGELRGIVVDEQGQPVAGATIGTGGRSQPAGVQSMFGQILKDRQASVPTVAAAETASDGTFAIAKLTPGSYQVRCHHSRFCSAVVPDVAITMKPGKPVRITLCEGAVVHGTVTKAGAPAAGYRILVTASKADGSPMPSEPDVQTDEQGRYQLHTRLPNGDYRIQAYALGNNQNPFESLIQMKASQREFRIEPGKDKVEQNIEL